MSHKMDHHLIALSQPHEIATIRNKYRVKAKDLRAVVAELAAAAGKTRVVSRDDIMIRLTELGLIKSKVKEAEEAQTEENQNVK